MSIFSQLSHQENRSSALCFRNLASLLLLSLFGLASCTNSSEPSNMDDEAIQTNAPASSTVTHTITSPTSTPTNTPLPLPTKTPSFTPTPTITDEEAIRGVFQAYQEAIDARDYEVAFAIIDDRAFEFYAETNERARILSPETMKELPIPLADKLTIYWLRHMFSFSELETITPEELFIFALEKNWIGSGLENVEIDEVFILREGEFGSISIVNKPDLVFINFYSEDGIWSFSPLYPAPLADWEHDLSDMLEESGLPEEEFFLLLLEGITGEKVDEAIFQGPPAN